MAIYLERGAGLYVSQLMPLLLSISNSVKSRLVFTFLVPAHLDSPGKRAIKRVRVRACVRVLPFLEYSLTQSFQNFDINSNRDCITNDHQCNVGR